ncbi:hypothetical protein FHR90_000679 [Endobacter medicaginis]|uniref:Schlafen group 3-like DNA/RNA helicase domain-containing protein n=3 Tax=Endobacter medicaginis TaxID=1181271 RepID=A0A839UW24_9PROT|nr:hypothetical protein [Endobacter medicaginis]MCX5474791.1 DUF2075 domain-containing protein [Endobacter medicaginis]
MSGCWWSGDVRTFIDTPRDVLLGRLAQEMVQHFRTNEAQQLRAWACEIDILRDAFATDARPDWHVVFEFTPPRMQRRSDVILLHPGGIVVLEFKIGATGYDIGAREQVVETALDLQDFHAGSTRYPIIPVLVATEAPDAPAHPGFPIAGMPPSVICANARTLGPVLEAIAAALPRHGEALDPAAWLDAPYRAMPGIIAAACSLYARHDVGDILAARADAENLTRTTETITAALGMARCEGVKIVLFVTGIPGAGKTLCGLNAAFATGLGATFLTGNPTLVHVLREALARSQAEQGGLAAQRQKMEGKIQALPSFRDGYAANDAVPPERVIVIDEAQRSWSEDYAIRKSRDRRVRLTASEPAHLLDAMGRQDGFAAIICLIGQGQEIHDGEGGLAEWSRALAARPDWRIGCAQRALDDPVARQRLERLPGLDVMDGLHLTVAVRAIRNADAPAWVDAVLTSDADAARAIASRARLPFRLTRRLDALRDGLRHACHPGQRCGLIASSGAKRLRAEGLGAELPHMDAAAVAHWFLDRFPDIRASDALDTVATQFSVQGLELDHVGLCWGGDLIRRPDGAGWQVRRLSGTAWQTSQTAEKVANLLNTYRVLLTRARYETLIWVPQGDARDATRLPAMYDAIADFLLACGVTPLPDSPPVATPAEASLFDIA